MWAFIVLGILLLIGAPMMFPGAGRLLKQLWTDAQLLAEETYLILKSDTPLEHNAPLTIRNQKPDSTDPPLELFPPLDIPGIQITNADGTVTTVGENGIENTDADGNVTRPGGGGLQGRIVSGSGQTYSVDLFENGISAAATRRVTATAPNLDEDEDIEDDTWVGINQAGVQFIIQISSWQ